MLSPGDSAIITLSLRPATPIPSVGKQKFLIEAGLTPLSHVTDIASGLKAVTSPVFTQALRAIFRPPTAVVTPQESPKSKPIRASYSTFHTENNSSILELQRLKDRLDEERAGLLARLTQLQASARRNYLEGKEADSEVIAGFSLLHLLIVLTLGLWIGVWLRS